MIYVLNECALQLNPYLHNEIHKFRHKVFVERLSWAALDSPDGREVDRFDDENAVHIVDVVYDQVKGYSRLLPTDRPHLLSHIYPELLQGRASPRASTTYEWTRLGAIARSENELGSSIRRIMAVMPEICAELGLRSLIAQANPLWVRRLIRLGWQVKTLAPPVVYNGEMVVPFEAHLMSNTAATSYQVLRMSNSVDVSWMGWGIPIAS
ncbi:autoinducer synthase [Agrobacterium tumefaciens]|uniref:acyl-homoserine-lactone synthase n=1 Tax=Agrobacterium tumefaciens TaxID=358 RepID=UPI0015733D13|nr:acyl-homoserine-lactone synthase [Agrobacterium tumefaciens]NSY99775.1 autoinducer synthase [Agrobacterium tumefaciens]NSZ40590.1 autoinducer synthase [Agrobacterium tumefaciens]NTB24789.1 autoinducer synthase [Agrobacterium tumefaciens]NTB28915.1 autoinducer synthase [Agrobacterium tumefaciens]NTB36950.1 autoinducer synthase [Agrobacterium tumefaciens]